MSDTKTVASVVETQQSNVGKDTGVTYFSNMPDSLESIDKVLADIHMVVDESANESQKRPEYVFKALVNYLKAQARAAVAEYERNVDAMAKLPVYKKSHTRDAVENIFLATRDGKIMAERSKIAREILENPEYK